MRKFARLIFAVATCLLIALSLISNAGSVANTTTSSPTHADLVASSSAFASNKSNPNDFRTIIEPYGQIFPAFELASLSLAHKSGASITPNTFGSEDALIGASIVTNKADQALTLTISAPGLLSPSSLSIQAPRARQRYTLYPSLRWNVQALRAVKQPRAVTLTFELYSKKARIAVRHVAVTLRSSNDVLYGVKDPDSKKTLDFNWLFAAFVDERSPAITDIIAKATTSGVLDKFQGYALDDPEEVYAQVFAVWHTLQKRGIRYSNLGPIASSFKTQNVSSQYVRFVSDTWASQKANCVDGSVLIASALKRVGLAPVLVVLPGHMLVGVALDDHGGQYAYLETTRLEAARSNKAGSLNASLENFEAALAEGQRQIDAAGSRFEDAGDLSYQMIDIQAARDLGVMPITQH